MPSALYLNTRDRDGLQRAISDPVVFIEAWLRSPLWPYQREIARAVWTHRRVSVAGCHGPGKSYVASRLGLAYLLSHPGSVVLTSAPTWRQVEGVLWREIHRAYRTALSPVGGELMQTKLKLRPDWFALGFSADSSDALQGWHAENILVILDEASGIDQRLYPGIEGILSSDGARLLQIGNPTDPNTEFARSFQDPSVWSRKISAFETPNFTQYGINEEDIRTGNWQNKIKGRPLPAPYLVTPEWVADKYTRWGPQNPIYLARVLSEFPQEGRNSLIPMAWIHDAQRRQRDPEKRAPKILGVDVAREGSDETACYLRHGDRVRRLFTSQKERTTETFARIAQAFREHRPDSVNVDAVGVGAGVCDMLAREGMPHKEIKFGASPVGMNKDDYANLKAQLYWNIRKRFEEGRIDIDETDEELVAQAGSVQWKPNHSGKIEIESKGIARSRGSQSPDRFEALVYAFADDVIDSGGFFLV